MVATAFKLNRQGDGFFDVGDPHHRQYRHHHFSDGKRMVSWRFHKQQARLIRDVQADGCGNLARVTTDPVTADGTFTTFIDILQQHRLELFGLSGGQFHRVLTFHQTHQLVSDTIHHNQHFFVGADDVVIKRCAFDDGLCGARQVGGLIHHHRGIAGTGGNQAFISMFARRVHHRFAASHHQQANTGIFEQPLGGFDIRVRHGDQQIFRATGGDHRLIEEGDCPLRDLFRRRMRGKHDAVACGNQADGVINHRRRRIGGRRDRGHHTPRRIFNQRQAVIAGQHLRR